MVLVSGGSRGLGLAIVTDLLDAGLTVAAFARTVTPELEKLAAEHPDRVHVGAVDVTDLSAAQGFVRAVEARFGPIDGLVNNAADRPGLAARAHRHRPTSPGSSRPT